MIDSLDMEFGRSQSGIDGLYTDMRPTDLTTRQSLGEKIKSNRKNPNSQSYEHFNFNRRESGKSPGLDLNVL